VEVVAALGVIGCLGLLLAWTSRRWGRPRLYLPVWLALWAVAAILAMLVLWLALD
jgi:hypothetical protein